MALKVARKTSQINNNQVVDNNDVNSENFDIIEYSNSKKEELRKLPEVEQLTSLIEIDREDSILEFGKEASAGIAKVSESLLNTIQLNRNEENSKLLVYLAKIMDQFDIDDFTKENQGGLLQRIFKKANNAIEAIFKKYETLGGEVSKIQVELEKYEREIKQSNNMIDKLLNENMGFYNELQKYIVAGEMAIDEMENDILPEYKRIAETSTDQMDTLNYQQLLQANDMIQQRVYDLRTAENIAIQTIPMLRGMKSNNFGLIRKINSAFVVTLPVFKQCLSQAVLIKKQELQSKSLKALDDKTNELLLRNAQNVTQQSANIARLNANSSIQVETLEKMYNTIKAGIDETMRIQESSRETIKENSKRLEEINSTFLIDKR
ncbi:MAG: toxic anion resistance protein [Paraclostridium sordellii]|uniref:Tellurite associated resistance protein n=1 Tax=Paraclostridium sordellii TaxID=1505 RepID=A0A9P1KY79_PARSO|nr:toxic anion resistance protein [Paeniclostridium sordellii]MBS6025449.1 toxic anion resistance protein [Paeniclostridium sordellii]RGX04178.1 toxic anion resistance protein [Paeniclostridium sordellii]CEN31538.1 tellurite associated resistance protein [[Clostridium] sordellii] [Paeniclostridium sordellii]CEP50206.1 tellurite associated resistance protein [[Clostridium] sordellii] [Paeniclostridium sordellii]CEP91015.1 tellurite associated resistance protein [[Clostridium] sordellii] [Paenic